MPDIDDVKAIAAPYRIKGTMTPEAHMEAWRRCYDKGGNVATIVDGRLWINGVDRTSSWREKYVEFCEGCDDDGGYYYIEPN